MRANGTSRAGMAAGAVLALALAGCADVRRELRAPKAAVDHPVAARLVRSLPVADQVAARDADAVLPAPLAGLRRDTAIGVLEGPAGYVFGDIADVQLDPAGNLVALDRRMHQLRAFTPAGRLVYAVGRSGAGPGELASPVGMTLDGDGRAYVADSRNMRLSVFAPGENTLVYERAWRLDFEPMDLCAMDGLVYVHGMAPGREEVIHVFTPTGERVRSFGRIYAPETWLVERQLSEGRIACLPGQRAVAYLPDLIPEVRVYSAEGELRWSSVLTDYKPILMQETPDGAVTQGTGDAEGDGGWHFSRALAALPDGRVAVQVGYVNRETIRTRSGPSRVQTYVFSAATGEGTYVGERVPVLDAAVPGLVVSIESEPFPRMVLHRTANQGGSR